ncbi:MAG: glycosyltransferase [Pseudomonadota bacterium]
MINWKERGKWGLYSSLVKHFQQVDILQPYLFNARKRLITDRITILLSEFYLPFIILFKRNRYDAVFSWSMRMGIIYGVLNRVFRRRNTAHVIYDFHINLTRTDLIYRLRLLLLKIAIPGIDYFLTTSEEEKLLYSSIFSIRPSKIRFFPMGPPRHYLNKFLFKNKGYILAYGNSDRDYDTLIKSIEGINEQVIILTQAYTPPSHIPPNVKVMTRRREGIDLIQLIASARLVVLPLKDASVSSGQTAMLEAMALGRPLIVTSNMATREYAVNKKTALFYEAGNWQQLKESIQLILDNPDFAEEIGIKGRKSMKDLIDKSLSVFLDLLQNNIQVNQ